MRNFQPVETSRGTSSMNCRALAILIAAMLACQFTLSGPVQALSLKSTAHCLGHIQTSNGNVIVDLGQVSSYYNYTPQDASHQHQCASDTQDAVAAWFADKGKMCHTFLAVNGATLYASDKLGSRSWHDVGNGYTPDTYGYPSLCFAPTGHVFPSYYISTLIYAPPGCTPSIGGYDCGSGNYVDYSSSSTVGTTTSIEKSAGWSTSFTAKMGVASMGGSFSTTSTHGSDVTTSHTAGNELKWPDSGSVGGDGINHDLDQFFLLLNPSVAVSGWHDPITGQNQVQWSLGTKNNASARVQQVQVSYLRCALAGVGPRPGGVGYPGDPTTYDPSGSCAANPNLVMPGVPDTDASAPSGFLPGLTVDDYKQILAQDLFWNTPPNQAPQIPASRFQKQPYDFTYHGPSGTYGNSCASQHQSINNDYTNTITSTTEKDYKASMTLGSDMSGVITGFDTSMELTWTNKISTSHMTESTQKAEAVVGCASANWTGGGQGLYFVGTYYDAVYGTYLFALENTSGQRLVQGHVADADGDLVPHEPLKLVVGGNTYRSFSQNNGQFFFNLLPGQAYSATTGTLFVGASGEISQNVPVGPAALATVTIPTPPPSLSVALGAAPAPNSSSARTATPVTPPPAPIYIAVTNRSLFATAKNVTVTAVQATSKTGRPPVFSGSLPFAVPGGTRLNAGSTANFPLTFNNATGPMSFLSVTVKADNLAPFSTILIQPAGSPALE